ncbi:MAG: tetratricopeptide repeat protein [Treponema sp.]|nr:tetratricopeptide repeat protein [Candidatus Treponema caballi]
MRKKVVTIVAVFCLLFCLSGLSAETSQNSLLVQGLEAYRRGDWTSALFFLRKAGTQPENINAETWYILVMSEMYAGDYESVLSDGTWFLTHFPGSSYVPQIEYQIGRSHFIREDYEEAVETFTSFCNSYPEHELVSSALFWMAEALYQTFHFDEAAPIFERIVKEYPDSPKVTEAAFRIELLNQRVREEKLLYLLRVTGEEYLAAREDYERQIRESQTDEMVNMKTAITALQTQVDELQNQLEVELSRNRMLTSRIEFLVQQNSQLQQIAEDALTSQKKQAAESSRSEKNGTAVVSGTSETASQNQDELDLLKKKEALLRILLDSGDQEGESR